LVKKICGIFVEYSTFDLPDGLSFKYVHLLIELINMTDKDVNITYDTLFELLRREKGREKLQQLQSSFFEDVVNYLKEKEAIVNKPAEGNLFSDEEKEKTNAQLENVRKIIKELYERRERKLVEMAMFKSRTNSGLINNNNMLPEEKILFDSIVAKLNMFRSGIVMRVIKGLDTFIDSESGKNSQNSNSSLQENKDKSDNAKVEKVNIMVKFTNPVPKFVGKELESYGPFLPEDTANLPRQIAEILIKKGKAEEITMAETSAQQN